MYPTINWKKISSNSGVTLTQAIYALNSTNIKKTFFYKQSVGFPLATIPTLFSFYILFSAIALKTQGRKIK